MRKNGPELLGFCQSVQNGAMKAAPAFPKPKAPQSAGVATRGNGLDSHPGENAPLVLSQLKTRAESSPLWRASQNRVVTFKHVPMDDYPGLEQWICGIETTADGQAPLPAILAAEMHPIPVYVSYDNGGQWVKILPCDVRARSPKRGGYKLVLTELDCIGPPRGGLCFCLANVGTPVAHWTPRCTKHAIGQGHCWFDSVRQEIAQVYKFHAAAKSHTSARGWFGHVLRERCKADSNFADALARFVLGGGF